MGFLLQKNRGRSVAHVMEADLWDIQPFQDTMIMPQHVPGSDWSTSFALENQTGPFIFT
jgi:hypothetical protein